MRELTNPDNAIKTEMVEHHYDIPTSVVRSSRREIDDTHLTVQVFELNKHSQLIAIQTTDVELPSELTGSYFIAAALSQPGSQVINGDGMIYRIQFVDGRATLKTRIAKTPCYYADQVTQQSRKYPEAYCFKDAGPSRMSSKLGNRNQLNTAFLQTHNHLIVTFDAGIPWIIDPASMELIEPVGRMDEWLSITDPFAGFIPVLRDTVLPPHSNPAHPVCDRHAPEKDFPNCQSSDLKTLPNDHFLTLNYSVGYKGKFRKNVDRVFGWVRQRTVRALSRNQKNVPCAQRVYGFTDLIRYTFKGRKLERWQLVLPDWDAENPDVEKLVIGEQSIHQMAITKDYIILVDMAFKIEYSQLFSPYIVGLPEKLLDNALKFLTELGNGLLSQEKLSRQRLKLGYYLYSFFLKLLPPSQVTSLYIISRADLQACSNNPGSTVSDSPKSIRVRKVTIPREVSHLTADYNNPQGRITLHVGHQNGTDVTEWISKYDRPVKEKQSQSSDESFKRLAGMTTGAMDVSSFGRYIIDGETGALLDSKVFSDVEHTWWPSVYTHRDICRDRPSEDKTETVKNMFWMCWGFSWEIIPDRIYQAYKNREFRVVHYTQLPETGKPCKLLRLDTESMEIADWFDFPPGHFACSPQFIPKTSPCSEGQKSTHGYIVCVVLADTPDQSAGTVKATPQDEIWIFDANNLGNRQDVDKPATIYKLTCPSSLNFGLTIHSIWLSPEDFAQKSGLYSDLETRQDLRRQAFWRDYGALVGNADDGNPAVGKPRPFEKIDNLTKVIFQEIQASFIEQKPECP